MKIRLCETVSGLPSPYGLLTSAEREFIREFMGEEFSAERHNMNYYRLNNGMKVHVYNAVEVSPAPSGKGDSNGLE